MVRWTLSDVPSLGSVTGVSWPTPRWGPRTTSPQRSSFRLDTQTHATGGPSESSCSKCWLVSNAQFAFHVSFCFPSVCVNLLGNPSNSPPEWIRPSLPIIFLKITSYPITKIHTHSTRTYFTVSYVICNFLCWLVMFMYYFQYRRWVIKGHAKMKIKNTCS